MSDISNFVQRGTDIMLGELNVSQVSHGPCMHLSPLPLNSAAQTHVTSPFWHRGVPKGVGSASLRGGGARFTLSCRFLSLGIAAVIEFCLAACGWPCMRHRLNGLCYKFGLFQGLLLDLRTFGWPDYNHCWSIARHLTCKVTLFCHTVVWPLVTNTW